MKRTHKEAAGALVVAADATPAALVAAGASKAAKYASEARAEATRRAYAVDWRQFCQWCEARAIDPLPASPVAVAMWVADLADTHAFSSIGRKLAAVSVKHKEAGLPSPIGLEPVPSTMDGIRRRLHVATSKKAPVRVSHIRSAMADFPDDLKGKRDRALILVGYAGAFRRCELVAVDLEDVRFVPEGAVITVRRSKTDQGGKGHQKALHYGKNRQTCPVWALRAWIEAARITEGPVFRGVNRWGHVSTARLTSQVVADVVKERAPLLGLDPAALGAHSLRAGLVTDGYASGVSEADIMRQTGHRSRAVLEGYYREANLFRGNVTASIGL